MGFAHEQHYKAALIEEAFELHDIVLPNPVTVYTDNHDYQYRNKVEFSWYGHVGSDGTEQLDLAFFKRGSKGKVIIEQCALLHPAMLQLATQIRDVLRNHSVQARDLKTLLIRCDQKGSCVWQLYTKQTDNPYMQALVGAPLPAQGGEIIYSDPKSPASRITKRLHTVGNPVLTDIVLSVPFFYATEGFFQINLPVYEQALKDMRHFIKNDDAVVDLYSGVGSIGLTIGGNAPELIEVNEDAVREMKRNIKSQASHAKAILAPSEKALDYITDSKVIIVDPPRAGLHKDVIDRLTVTQPPRIIYLSCNPATQARDIALLLPHYTIAMHKGYNFFPHTPHIEHLVVLDKH